MRDSKPMTRPHDSLISAEENTAMFDHIAGYYDGTNRLLSLGMDRLWRRRAVAALNPRSGGAYLDVGCGTGDVCIEILRQAPGSRAVGIDKSEGMLALGRNKLEAAGLAREIDLLAGDALDLQFSDRTFDGVITSFCIRNVTDRQRALLEFRRVLRSGANLVVLELTDPKGPVMGPLFNAYSRVVMPLVAGALSSVPAYRYLSDSMADFPDADDFAVAMNQAGFEEAGYFHMTGGIVTCFFGRAP